MYSIWRWHERGGCVIEANVCVCVWLSMPVPVKAKILYRVLESDKKNWMFGWCVCALVRLMFVWYIILLKLVSKMYHLSIKYLISTWSRAGGETRSTPLDLSPDVIAAANARRERCFYFYPRSSAHLIGDLVGGLRRTHDPTYRKLPLPNHWLYILIMLRRLI